MNSMVVSSSTRTMSLANDKTQDFLNDLDQDFNEDPEMNPQLQKRLTVQIDKDTVAEKVIHARKRPEPKGKRASAQSMVNVAGSFTGGIRKSGLVYKRQASNNNRLRSSSRNSRNINQSIVDMVTDEKSFQEQFEQSRKKEVKLTKKHTFDSRQTVITVGPDNLRFPFDTEEHIFTLRDANQNCLKANGIKTIKIQNVQQENCGVCRKPKSEFKNKKVAQCEFCAIFGCIDCIYKMLPFPQVDRQDRSQNFGLACLVCETKLHINTVTSDILKALQKAELRVDARERRID